MSARPSDRAHARDVELGIEAQALATEEERRLCRACAELKAACEKHAALTAVVRELTGRIDSTSTAGTLAPPPLLGGS